MQIDIQELSSVDREIIITASQNDLSVSIEKALKKLRSTIQMPGFRQGHVPLNIVKSRYGKEVEFEEARKFVLDVYENDIVPDHKPVGETQFLDLKWEDGKLEARLKIGIAPIFELKDLATINVEKLVHDVTDEEVLQEMERMYKKESTYTEISEPITAEHRVTVDAMLLNEQGAPIEGATEQGQQIDLSLETNETLKKALLGKRAGLEVDVTLGENDDTARYRMSITKVESSEPPAKDEAFFGKLSNNTAKTEEEFKAQLKSEIQNYYDRQSDEMFRNDVRLAVIAAHDFPVPEVVIEMIIQAFFEDYKKRQKDALPPNFNIHEYRHVVRPAAIREARWSFLSESLQQAFPDLELTPADVDDFLANEAARYGLPVEVIKQYYASNTEQLNQLRNTIREQKLFAKMSEKVNIVGLDKDTFSARQQEKQAAEQALLTHSHDHDHDHDHTHHH